MTVQAPQLTILNASIVEAFAGAFLSPRYDDLRQTPEFHRTAWELYTSSYPQAGCVAPRDHAKSTALTFDFILAETLWRISDYVILIGSTEDKAAEQLSNISDELQNNEDLVAEFGIKSFPVNGKTEIIVECQDGFQFRILARGAEQKIRGALWKGKRPNLIVCDDMEDDEQVESKERRRKFRRWFFRAAKQALSKKGRIRVHGTILHEDSLLARLCKNKEWRFLYYKAHAAFDDFSNILWKARWTEEELRARQREFIEDGDAAGYAQEFLNDPQDHALAFFRPDDFIPMSDEDKDAQKRIAAGWDFAVSKADLANRTSCTVGGRDANNTTHFLDFRVGRWHPSVTKADKARGEQGWIDLMFEVDTRWRPEVHFVEGGGIWQSVKNMVYQEMSERNHFFEIVVINPQKDKATRATPLKKRHRAGATRWNTEAEGFEGAKDEMMKFTGLTEAKLDDQVDSAATLVLGFESWSVVDEEDFLTEEDREMEMGYRYRGNPLDENSSGRSAVTGY